MTAEMRLIAENTDAVILVVDDSQETLDLIEFVLKDAGYLNIITTTIPDDVVDFYKKHNPDVVLLDLYMPGMDGIVVLAELRKNCNQEYLPVIVLTGEEDTDVKVNVLQNGAKDYIQKPFDHFEMLARVNTIASMSMYYKELLLKNQSLNFVVAEQTDVLMHAVREKEQAEQKLENTLLHDRVTGLPNRYLFEDRLTQLVEASKRNKTKVAVVVLGFDNYSEINNTIGHAEYDELLRKITLRFKSILRTSDTVSIIQDATSGTALSRIGEDLFAIIIPIFQTINDINKVIDRCVTSLLEPIDLPDTMFDIVVRAGISYFPEHGDSPDALIQHANIGLYYARDEHKEFMVYDIAYDRVTKYRLNLMAELKNAIANNQLELYYQPKINLTSNKVMGCEALIRWIHPEYGFVEPDSFIPMAEQTGTIRLLTIWVINQAIRQCALWCERDLCLSVSINLSAHDLSDPTLVELVYNNIKKYAIDPALITLEVTESSTMQDPATSMNTMHQLSALGVKLSIDDYGTGYSSLSYLKSLPVDEIKIDKSFVINMDEDKDNSVIVKSTVELAHNLGYRVVAEGIENELIYAVLQAYNCDIGQGYYMCKPQPASDVEQWLGGNKWQLAL